MSMNLDSSDIVESLEGFESLENIQHELEMLNRASNENVRVVRAEDMEIMQTIVTKEEIDIVKEELDDPEDDEMTEAMNSRMDESISAEMLQVMELHGGEAMQEDDVEDHDDFGQHESGSDVNGEDQTRLFSEGIIGDEEIIDDSQVITEDVGDVHHILAGDQMHDEQILMDTDVKYLDDIMNDDVNETIIEAEEVEDRTGDGVLTFSSDQEGGEEEMPAAPRMITMQQITDEIITADRELEIITGDKDFGSTMFVNPAVQIPKIEKPETGASGNRPTELSLPPLVVSSKSEAQVQEAVKSITSGVFVVNSTGNNTSGIQSIIQSGGTLIASKDAKKIKTFQLKEPILSFLGGSESNNTSVVVILTATKKSFPPSAKFSRVVTFPSLEGGANQNIRIVAPPGKINSTTKTITLAQARQMGLISPSGRITNILPSTAKPMAGQQLGIGKLVVPPAKKTVTVMKSSPTKILPAPPAFVHKTQKVVIRQGSNLKPGTLVASTSAGHPPGTQMIRIPANQTIQQILPGGSKQVQYVKLVSTGGGGKGQTLVPVSLSKTIPVLTTNLLNSATTTFKVVPISTQAGSSTVPGQRMLIPASAVSSTQQALTSPSQIVMLPSHLLQQVKKGDCKLVPAMSSAGLPALRPTTVTVNGNRKVAPAPPVPPLKMKEPSVPVASSTPLRLAAAPPLTTVTTSSPPPPPLLPPLLPTLAAPPLSPPMMNNLQTSPPSPPTAAGPEAVSLDPNNPFSSLNMLPQPKIEVKQEQWSGDESYLEANGIRPRKPCNCTKSMCLKLYCDCFANGEFCYQCNCTCCYNNLDHEEERQRAIKSCLDRNPTAFKPKIGKTLTGSEERRHNKGCNCKRSGCLKNYCECFEAKIPCSKNCKCIGCRNTDSYSGKRGGGDEERSRYRTDYKPYENRPNAYSSACRQAFSMLSTDVIQATAQCLIAHAEKFDKTDDEDTIEDAQKRIIEEFGNCLVQIIDCVTKSIPQQAPASTPNT